jgi:hypothetical protein
LVPASFKFFDLSLAFSLVFPVMVPTIDFYWIFIFQYVTKWMKIKNIILKTCILFW